MTESKTRVFWPISKNQWGLKKPLCRLLECSVGVQLRHKTARYHLFNGTDFEEKNSFSRFRFLRRTTSANGHSRTYKLSYRRMRYVSNLPMCTVARDLNRETKNFQRNGVTEKMVSWTTCKKNARKALRSTVSPPNTHRHRFRAFQKTCRAAPSTRLASGTNGNWKSRRWTKLRVGEGTWAYMHMCVARHVQCSACT